MIYAQDYTLLQYGESYGGNEASLICNSNFQVVGNIEKRIHMHIKTSYHQEDQRVDHDKVTYAFLENISTIADEFGNA